MSLEATPVGSREDVVTEYARRLGDRRATLARELRHERAITDLRLVVFVAGVVLAWLAWGKEWVAAWWVAVPVIGFLVLVVLHARARRASHRAERAVAFYERGLARVEDRWAGKGEGGLRFVDESHPYASDLDLFGAGSLFERLCTARTRAGEDMLAAWLLHPARCDEILGRQAAVSAVRPRLDFREDLERLGADVRDGIDPESLVAWGASQRVFRGNSVRVAAGLLAAWAVAALVAWGATDIGPTPFLAALISEVAFAWCVSGSVRGVLEALDRRTHELVVLSDLLARLEREPFEDPTLRRIRAALDREGRTASRRIAGLVRRLQLLEAQENQVFMPLAAILLWKVQLALTIDTWRGRNGPEIAGWLAAVGEFEALCALAAYAWENPGDPFPVLEPAGVRFEAEGMGHPLISSSTCVRNDVALGEATRVFVVSGSNMSGKSTLLRTIGVNAVLALAGGPVRADLMRITPLAIGATLRIQDSLQAGRSRFFAEITRLRQLVDLTHGPLPLLFLLDEILHGTNSHDRRVGGEAVVRGFIERGAIGLVTTHDLALAEIVDRLGPVATNVHFEDHFENGTLHFDYRMRPGVVRKSNALELMRAVGLEV